MSTPNGWKLVPVEATGEQQADGRDAMQPYLIGGRVAKPVTDQWQIAREVYAKMIAAAPSPPSVTREEIAKAYNAGVQAAWECATAMANSLPMQPVTHGAKVMRDAAMDIADAILGDVTLGGPNRYSYGRG